MRKEKKKREAYIDCSDIWAGKKSGRKALYFAGVERWKDAVSFLRDGRQPMLGGGRRQRGNIAKGWVKFSPVSKTMQGH